MVHIQSALCIYFEYKLFLQFSLYNYLNEVLSDISAAPTETIQFKMKIEFIVMYGQYSVHVVQIYFEFQIFIAFVSVYLTRWYPSDISPAPTQTT